MDKKGQEMESKNYLECLSKYFNQAVTPELQKALKEEAQSILSEIWSDLGQPNANVYDYKSPFDFDKLAVSYDSNTGNLTVDFLSALTSLRHDDQIKVWCKLFQKEEDEYKFVFTNENQLRAYPKYPHTLEKERTQVC